jgi:predicted GH43/DUF377 family glycosyl hydrolase
VPAGRLNQPEYHKMNHLPLLFFLLTSTLSWAQKSNSSVSNGEMEAIYNEIKTPYKYGLVLVPEDDSRKTDSPSVFRKGKNWYMTYIVFDGRGYETWLASSTDLLQWKKLGRLLTYGDSAAWDGNQRAGYLALQDHVWGGSYAVKPFNGKHWMSYLGGAVTGYEAGELSIGMAYTEKDPSRPHEWQRLVRPVLTSHDQDKRWWENTKLFKSTVIHDRSLTTGYPFVMYYNAAGDSAVGDKKRSGYERIGMAVSKDMTSWKRFGKDPVLHHSAGITGDAIIQKIGDIWVAFYFGAFWEDRKGAFNRFACSKDLVNWTDWEGENLIESSEPFDDVYAHKSSVVKHQGVVYHFYCAVNKKDQRGIAVATSVDKGSSIVSFEK